MAGAGRRFILPLLLVSLASPYSAEAYSVLSHEQLIDLSWRSAIVPLLLSRFPTLTPEQLRKAHANAYGGCVIQDLGYYPFGNAFFSDLTHYVRSGDFVQSLFRNAHTANELAFAIGALSHYIGDSVGHSQATNPSVAIEFPKLRAKYGPSVNFAQGKNAHGRVEFAFDIDQIAKERLPPEAYLHFIGLEVPRNQIIASFSETYGLNIRDIVGLYRTALRTYRFGARSFLPSLAYAEALLHSPDFPAEPPTPELDLYEQHIAQLHKEVDWHRYRKKPGVGTYLLAGLIVILPKIGPAEMLAIKGPTVDTEGRYIKSVNLSTASLSRALKLLVEPAGPRTLPADLIPNRDLDTGARVVPGGYPLTDETYAKLLAKLTKNPAKQVPVDLKQDILRYYADPNAPISTKQNRKKWDQVQTQLKVLTVMSTRAQPVAGSQPPQELELEMPRAPGALDLP